MTDIRNQHSDHNHDSKQLKSQEHQEENIWVELTKTLATAFVLAFGIRTFVAEARYIPSESMLPTLQVNDRLIIEKISYHFKAPQRGDVVVFEPTQALVEQNFKDAFIKRIIGLPGETIQVKNGTVFVDSEPLKEKYIEEKPQYDYGPIQVPPNQFLVLGDNRNNSYDSHYWGFVPRSNFIGKAALRFWPPDRMGTLDTVPPDYQIQKN
jgi:signal peptidase I